MNSNRRKVKKEIHRFLFYSLLPLILFSLQYFLEGIRMDFFIRTALLLILINFVFLTFNISKVKKEKDEIKIIADLKKENNLLKDELINYRNSMDTYFINWTHQIKTPITSLKFLINSREDINSMSSRNKIKEQILSIEDYVGVTLNYLKLVDDKNKIFDFSEVNLDDIISEVIKKYSILFIANKVKLHYEKLNKIVLTDPKLTTQVLEQIISNSLKYSKDRDIFISFDEENNAIIVRDTGKGISSKDLPRVFEKGYSGYNGRFNQESSGLGLFIVKMISDKLNQRISLDSKLNEGTTFKMCFNKNRENIIEWN